MTSVPIWSHPVVPAPSHRASRWHPSGGMDALSLATARHSFCVEWKDPVGAAVYNLLGNETVQLEPMGYLSQAASESRLATLSVSGLSGGCQSQGSLPVLAGVVILKLAADSDITVLITCYRPYRA